MSKFVRLVSKRKGITPVIATVLLLGITVAIGLTVYTQAQGLIGNFGEDGKLQKVQQTSLKLSPVYSGTNGQIKVRVTNTGDRAINTSEFTMYYGPPDFPNPVAYSALPSNWKISANNDQCLSSASNSKVVAQGQNVECLTGVKFPGALQTVSIEVRANNFDYSTQKSCSVETAGARSC